jgi:phosphoadenosine phosphosulfate reductase
MSTLQDSLSLLRRAAEASRAESGESSVLIGLSGGKDSVVVLDLAKRVFDRVECYFMYLVDGLECVEAPLRSIARRYDVRLHKVPHFDLARFLKHAVYMPHRNGEAHRVRDLRFADIEALARSRAGIGWVGLGHRATDSLERNAMLKRLGGFDAKARRVYPIWRWKPRDVYAYLRAHRIQVAPQLVRGTTDGVNLYPETLRVLRAKFPADYRKILEVFPYAEAGIVRDELRKQWAAEAQQVPEVQG